MLSASNRLGEVVATEVSPEDGPFSCPACREQVILKQGRKVIAHFAHYPETACAYTGDGESDEHRLAKLEIYQALVRAPDVTDVRLERYLREVRPDVSFVLNGQLVALEIQASMIDRDGIAWRTTAYAKKNIAVLWMPLLLPDVCEERYAPKDFERYLHSMYFGKVYYFAKDLELQPVKFEEYMLAPSWYTGERRSKRFVTTVLRSPVLITDLVPRWRSAWRDVPRAKLWCEPWSENRRDDG